jgi:hypothetical protein
MNLVNSFGPPLNWGWRIKTVFFSFAILPAVALAKEGFLFKNNAPVET